MIIKGILGREYHRRWSCWKFKEYIECLFPIPVQVLKVGGDVSLSFRRSKHPDLHRVFGGFWGDWGMILGFSKPNLLAPGQLHRVWASSLLWTLGSLCMYHMKTYFVQSDEYEYIIRLPSDVYVQYEYYGEHWKWTTQSTTAVPLDHTW